MDLKRLEQNLSDAGCSCETAKDILKISQEGDMKRALHLMKKDRCRLMEELHECGRKVDCLDFLIRQTEKELQAKR